MNTGSNKLIPTGLFLLVSGTLLFVATHFKNGALDFLSGLLIGTGLMLTLSGWARRDRS